MSPGRPRVSVVLPAWNSAATLPACLDALAGQTWRDFEVIVVNSSTDAEASAIAARYGIRFEQSRARLLPHAARNRGVELATGDCLVFSDPDCVARPDWLARLIDAHVSGKPIVQGAMGLRRGGWLQAGIHLCKWHGLLAGPPRAVTGAATGNLLVSRGVFEEAGPFEPQLFCGDAVFVWRAMDRGYRVHFEPAAVVDQIHDHGLAELMRQRLFRGKEFAMARAGHGRWSRTRALIHVAFGPLALGLVVARAARSAVAAGLGGEFLSTLPISVVGHAAWTTGEMRGYWRRAVA
jgi:GT2 family glycosyltransferase